MLVQLGHQNRLQHLEVLIQSVLYKPKELNQLHLFLSDDNINLISISRFLQIVQYAREF